MKAVAVLIHLPLVLILAMALSGCSKKNSAGTEDCLSPGSGTKVAIEPCIFRGVIGDTLQDPEIEIKDIGPCAHTVSGLVRNIQASSHQVVLWVQTDRWYIQPLTNAFVTTMCEDGSWENWTHGGEIVLALIVSKHDYNPRSPMIGHPALDSGVIAFDQEIASGCCGTEETCCGSEPLRKIAFSGNKWTAKSHGVLFDPAFNSGSAAEVNGRLETGGRLRSVHATCGSTALRLVLGLFLI